MPLKNNMSTQTNKLPTQGEAPPKRRRTGYNHVEHGMHEGRQRETRTAPQAANNAFQTLDINLTPVATAETDCDTPQPFIDLLPAVVCITGGGLPALLSAKVMYWIADAEDRLPRSRPQPEPNNPAWMITGVQDVATQLGLADLPHRAGEKQVERALKRLVNEEILEYVDIKEFVQETTNWNFGLRLTNAFHQAIEQSRQTHFMRVYPAYMKQLDCTTNESICLAYLFHRCVEAAGKLRVVLDGEKWFAAGNEQISDETGLSVGQVRGAIISRGGATGKKKKGLEQKGLVRVRKERFCGHPTHHYQIEPAAIKQINEIKQQE